MVDVTKRVVEIYREPGDDRYEQMEVVRSGASITLVAFPDVSVAVSTILP